MAGGKGESKDPGRAPGLKAGRRLLPLGALFVALAGAGGGDPVAPAAPGERQRGVAWVAGDPIGPSTFQPLLEVGVNWIVQTPFGWQRRFDSPEVLLVTDGRIYWGERDEGIEETTRLARRFGIRTLLKPHVWLVERGGGKWRGDIEMGTEEAWQRWFASYRRFILHYARLAARTGIDALCVGTELHRTVRERPEDWRRLIGEIRRVFPGRLTYAANWNGEFEEVPFWKELDFIGIQAYFPLTDRQRPSLEELLAGWERHLRAIETVQRRHAKRVLFTEIGYRSTPDAAIAPWSWPEARSGRRPPVDLETQAKCYEAFFRTFWHREWFAGAHFWKWYPAPSRRGSRWNPDFSPQDKPAEAILARWYGAGRAAGSGPQPTPRRAPGSPPA